MMTKGVERDFPHLIFVKYIFTFVPYNIPYFEKVRYVI